MMARCNSLSRPLVTYSRAMSSGRSARFKPFIYHLFFLPSSQFLDAQRIHNLVTYLQDLHSLGLANSEHTTLLLNTYTKLKDVSRLDSFIKTESRTHSDGDAASLEEPPFDLETTIRVCRQAGYYDHASYLAKKYRRHEDYLRIQVEDAGNYRDALQYVRRLDRESVGSSLLSTSTSYTEFTHRRRPISRDMVVSCLPTYLMKQPSF